MIGDKIPGLVNTVRQRVEDELRLGALPRLSDYARANLGLAEPVVLLSGFWRSGTTWAQEVLVGGLRAKSVFEPLSLFLVVRSKRRIDALTAGQAELAQSPLYMPFLDDAGSSYGDRLRLFIERSLDGRSPGRWSRKLRSNFAETFRRGVVVKYVRGHLCLRSISRIAGLPLIHIVRDPRSVLVSMRQSGWIRWFDKPYLARLLIHRRDGPSQLFLPHEELIRSADLGSSLDRFVAFYALMELEVRMAATEMPDLIRIVRYEDLVLDPQTHFARVLNYAGVALESLTGEMAHSRDSQMTRQRGADTADRVRGWGDSLPACEIDAIQNIMIDTGVEHCLYSGDDP